VPKRSKCPDPGRRAYERRCLRVRLFQKEFRVTTYALLLSNCQMFWSVAVQNGIDLLPPFDKPRPARSCPDPLYPRHRRERPSSTISTGEMGTYNVRGVPVDCVGCAADRSD